MTAETQIDNYLNALRFNLGPIAIADREEIAREIGAHVRDSAEESGATIETVLDRLGPPEALAAQYRDGILIRQASRSISPLVLLRATLRLATEGIFGMLVFVLGSIGYLGGIGFVLTGFAKCVFPAHTGTWVVDGNVVASGTQLYILQPPAHEVLGMWYVPIAVTIGSLFLLFTTWAIRTSLKISRNWQAKL
jgi:uncharacterized membrane protein